MSSLSSIEATYYTDAMSSNSPDELREQAAPYGAELLPTADAPDPVLEVFKRDIDFSLVEKNLQLTTDERAQQLVNATRFIARFRPLVADEDPAASS
jgi:hypothetical protein